MENEKYTFIQKHEKEIRPVVDDQKLFEAIDHDLPVPPDALQSLIEQYETKVFSFEHKSAQPDAGRLLLEASQTANFKVLHPLIESLKSDERCAGIALLTDSIAGKRFVEEDDPDLHAIRESERPTITDIPGGPYRAALVLCEGGKNSPASVLLYGAKSVFGAEKLCYLSSGLFGHFEKKIFALPKPAHMEDIDIVISDDEFSKQMLCEVLNVPEEKVIVTGTPLLEGLRVEEADTLRAQGRTALGIPHETLTLLYSGFPSKDLQSFGGDPKLNFLTFEQTLAGVIAAAAAEPAKQFALIARSHPGARGVEPPLESAQELPHNLTVVKGDDITYEEAVYAADIICCEVSSTESLLARYRGREAAVFAFPGKGQSGELLKGYYGEKGEKILRQSDRMALINSPQELSEMVLKYEPHPALPYQPGSLDRIKDVLLSPESAILKG